MFVTCGFQSGFYLCYYLSVSTTHKPWHCKETVLKIEKGSWLYEGDVTSLGFLTECFAFQHGPRDGWLSLCTCGQPCGRAVQPIMLGSNRVSGGRGRERREKGKQCVACFIGNPQHVEESPTWPAGPVAHALWGQAEVLCARCTETQPRADPHSLGCTHQAGKKQVQCHTRWLTQAVPPLKDQARTAPVPSACPPPQVLPFALTLSFLGDMSPFLRRKARKDGGAET